MLKAIAARALKTLGLAALMLAGAVALAQNSGQVLTTLNSSDLIEIIRNGTQSHIYTTAANLRDGRFYALALTAASAGTTTMSVGQSLLVVNASGGLTSYNVVFPATTFDAKTVNTFSNQTITTLNLSTSNGASINNAVTTLAANADVAYVYDLATNTWYRYQ